VTAITGVKLVNDRYQAFGPKIQQLSLTPFTFAVGTQVTCNVPAASDMRDGNALWGVGVSNASWPNIDILGVAALQLAVNQGGGIRVWVDEGGEDNNVRSLWQQDQFSVSGYSPNYGDGLATHAGRALNIRFDSGDVIDSYEIFAGGPKSYRVSSVYVLSEVTCVESPLTFSTSTTASDPGSGHLRLNAGTQDAATKLYVSKTDSGTAPLSLATLASTTGNVRLANASAPATDYLVFAPGAVTDHGTWSELALTAVDHSSASPFLNAESIVLQIPQVT
jgi:hypothetical protein